LRTYRWTLVVGAAGILAAVSVLSACRNDESHTPPNDASSDATPQDGTLPPSPDAGRDGSSSDGAALDGARLDAPPADTSSPDGPSSAEAGYVDAGVGDVARPDGCITPYTPEAVVCAGSECNSKWQLCCPSAFVGGGTPGCKNLYANVSCGAGFTRCDGPEDCPPGMGCSQIQGSGGGVCAGCGGVWTPATCPFTSDCVCHSDADCPGAFPYCYASCVRGLPQCTSTPPSADAGVTYGACTLADSGPPNYGVACGGSACTSQSEGCCLGASSACQERPASTPPSSCSGLFLECDGPEDCVAGQVCCYDPGAPAAFCTGSCVVLQSLCSQRLLCHTSTDCPASQPSCVAIAGWCSASADAGTPGVGCYCQTSSECNAGDTCVPWDGGPSFCQ
jgi:hypothetical protein